MSTGLVSLCGQIFENRLTRFRHEQECRACDLAVHGPGALLPVKCPISEKCPNRFPDMKAAARHSSSCKFNTNEEEPS